MRATSALSIYATAALLPLIYGLPSTSEHDIANRIQRPSAFGFTKSIVHPSKGGVANCVSGFVSIEASTDKNVRYNFSAPANQSEVTQLILDHLIIRNSTPASTIIGTQHVSGTFDIWTTLCVPSASNATEPSSVHFLTHGVGLDGAYWDFAQDYSYVDIAVSAGHAVLFYDRLGTGLSSKPDPLNVLQGPLELEIANALIQKLRSGELSDISFSKVVGIGQSFGSVLTQALTASYPKSLDAAILTGYAVGRDPAPTEVFFSGLNLAIAANDQPYRFGGLPNAYIVAGSAISNQIAFFTSPGFDPKILSLADATKGLASIGELFSLGATTTGISPNFTGPVAVVNGDGDLPVCLGRCTTEALEQVHTQYPRVDDSKFATYIAPQAGHGLGYHYSAREAYEFVQRFLVKHGL